MPMAYAFVKARVTANSYSYCSLSCVVRYIIAKIQCLTAIFFFPGGQESSINSPYVPRMSHITRLLTVRFRLLLHLAAVS